MKDTIKGIIIGVVSSLIASGIVYGITEKSLWNIQLPLWGWLALSLIIFLHFILSNILYYYIKYEILFQNIQKVLLEIPMFIHGNSNEIGKGNIVFMDMKRQK